MPDHPLLKEGVFTVTELQEMSPELLGSVSHTTVNAWIRKGVKTAAGVVRLEAVKVGKRWKTSRQAVTRFFEATNREGDGV